MCQGVHKLGAFFFSSDTAYTVFFTKMNITNIGIAVSSAEYFEIPTFAIHS
jgi:TctA family transporter